MRRLLTTLMILLVVLVAGLTSLVLMVNPNDFRGYMVRQVEARSGYNLQLEGPLRWHVWPQLSILSGRMSLTAPGASQPVVSADNMRLDVALIPLLSHQLQVRQVMLKGAVIQLTPDAEAQRAKNAPVVPKGTISDPDATRGWSFDVSRLKVVDSVLVFQHGSDEQVAVRNINLQMEQDEKRQARIEFSSRITRDQRDLTLSLTADVNLSDYPQQITANLSQLNYQLQGAALPPAGISGAGSLQLGWHSENSRISLSQLQLTANDSDLQGDASVVLQDKPQWKVNLHSRLLNLDKLVVNSSAAGDGANQQAQQAAAKNRPGPVIAEENGEADYHELRDFNAGVNITAGAVQWRGLAFSDVQSVLANQDGILTISQLNGKLGQGTLSLPGVLDASGSQPKLSFQPQVNNIEIGSILTAFDYPIALSGQLSMSGEFSGDYLNAEAFRSSWQGDAQLELAHSRLQGMNFQQLIQQAVSRSNSGVDAQQSSENATELNHFTADASLDNGELVLNNMVGESSVLSLTGQGTMDLVKEVCDTNFAIKVSGGWKGSDSKLIEALKTTAIPLRVYGPWQQLNYSLQVDQVLRKQLQDEAKRRLNDWLDKHKDSDNAKDAKQLLKKL
ncbi:outer membrane assembly protein AsmA [Cedecea davisae]|uniref:Outer membrane assembly protein AsmA n=1 Tax=Cedecea davisae TaxID=158484 RepID=A0ABS6DIR3_9ENTR|nr:outer membrane assembly protein AsmA [Cedecea davisae]MBU4683013.1 outer membrane assembly protein AsmA [Cedecea davisae]MBU4687888.1 outer membrane assembly protein AsmA [Cedecea davisae]